MEGIGERLRAARREKRMTLEELSERCGLSPGFLSQVERGRSTWERKLTERSHFAASSFKVRPFCRRRARILVPISCKAIVQYD